MADRLTAAQANQGAAHFRPRSGTRARQVPYHFRPKTRMPRVDRKENCSPALATAQGFQASSRSRAAHSPVMES